MISVIIKKFNRLTYKLKSDWNSTELSNCTKGPDEMAGCMSVISIRSRIRASHVTPKKRTWVHTQSWRVKYHDHMMRANMWCLGAVWWLNRIPIKLQLQVSLVLSSILHCDHRSGNSWDLRDTTVKWEQTDCNMKRYISFRGKQTETL